MKKEMDDYKRIVRWNGDKVGLGTKKCKEWKGKHENCGGCASEVGCYKVVALGLLALSGKQDIETPLAQIMEAKTREALKEINLEPVPQW